MISRNWFGERSAGRSNSELPSGSANAELSDVMGRPVLSLQSAIVAACIDHRMMGAQAIAFLESVWCVILSGGSV
jgi:hypothetical protein